MRTWQLAAALLVIPSIPIAAWFSVLYFYFRHQVEVPPVLTAAMIVVGVLFVVNSLDSLIRLYSDNLNLTRRRLGTPAYVASHWLLMYSLVLAFQLTPLKIEWIGLVVIGLYAAIYALLYPQAADVDAGPEARAAPPAGRLASSQRSSRSGPRL